MGCSCSSSNHNKDIETIPKKPTSELSISFEKITVIIKIEGIFYFSKDYPANNQINEIIKDFLEINKNNQIIQSVLKNEINYIDNESNQIDLTKTLNEVSKEKEYIITIIEVGLKGIEEDGTKFLTENVKYFAKPSSNPFVIYLYNIEYAKIYKRPFRKEIIDSAELNLYSIFSSYCNGNNILYISGGDKEGEIIGKFWSIDLKSFQIELYKDEIEPRKFHSMIYIPSNYVFIIGGKDKLSVVYLNIEKKKFENYLPLPEELVEPSLVYINNSFIYAIANVNKFLIYKSNIRKKNIWERLEPILPNKNEITQKFFSIGVEDDSNTLIFIGGVMRSRGGGEFIYQYDIKKNEISQSTIEFKEINFSEKTLFPRGANIFFQIPNEYKTDSKIVVYNSKLNIINYNVLPPETIKKNLSRNTHSHSKAENFLSQTINGKQYSFNTPDLELIRRTENNQPPNPKPILQNNTNNYHKTMIINNKIYNFTNSSNKDAKNSSIGLRKNNNSIKEVDWNQEPDPIPFVNDTINLSSINRINNSVSNQVKNIYEIDKGFFECIPEKE